MAIELDVKPKDRFLFPATVMLVVSISIFSIFLASYFFFEIRSRMITTEIQNIDKKLAKTPDESALEAKMIGYQDKIDTFRQTIAERKDINKLLAVLERNAHPSVVVNKVSWSSETYTKADISATAENLESFAQQIMIWRKIPSFQSITLSALAKSTGSSGLEFTVQLTFDNGAFE